jgi:hypothetical protein
MAISTQHELLDSLLWEPKLPLAQRRHTAIPPADNSASVVHGPSTLGAPLQKQGKKKLPDHNFAASLDVAKLSNRKAAVVLTTTLKRLSCGPLKYSVNTSCIRRQQMNKILSFPLAHLLFLQRSLVVKLGIIPSQFRSLTRSHSLS